MNPFIDMVRFTPNERRYYLRSLGPCLVALPLTYMAIGVVERFRHAWPFEVLITFALMPLLPMAWAMKQYIDYFKACDEWERLIELYGICIGVLLVGMIYFGFGLLALAELVVLDGEIFAFWLLPAVAATYVLGKVIGRWRHG